jgi:hypothetical protein
MLTDDYGEGDGCILAGVSTGGAVCLFYYFPMMNLFIFSWSSISVSGVIFGLESDVQREWIGKSDLGYDSRQRPQPQIITKSGLGWAKAREQRRENVRLVLAIL